MQSFLIGLGFVEYNLCDMYLDFYAKFPKASDNLLFKVKLKTCQPFEEFRENVASLPR